MEKLENHVYLATPTIHDSEMKYIQEAFERNWVAPLGFNVDEFENEMSAYLGTNPTVQSLALSSGTAALHLAVKLAGVKKNDTVFCSDMTFVATVAPVTYEGGRQVFIDSERDTWNMDPNALETAFEKYPETKVVILAHLYGTPAKIDPIRNICANHGAILIEDAAESLSTTYKGKQTGTFGQYGAFSFNGNKIITSSGGGMLITKNVADHDKALFLATQAREKTPWYQHEVVGYNYRMSNIVAGIGRGQLQYLEDHRMRKEKIYRRYEIGLKGLPVHMNPYEKNIASPNFWLSAIQIDKGIDVTPMKIYEHLANLNIESRPIWKPMHLQPVYKNNDFISVNGDVGADIFSRGLCLPSDIKMSDEEQDCVIMAIRELF